jgi:plastocyanin
MKNKVFFALAMVVLVAAGCNSNNKNAEENQQQVQQESVNEEQNTNNEEQAEQPAQQTNNNNSESTPTFSSEEDLGVVDQPEVKEIKITANGFSPSTIEIRKGDYVQFTNSDSARHWPASDPHPAHTGLAGFDAKKGLSQGETYRYQFNKTGTFGFHDHMNSSLDGTVIVK